MGGHKFHGDLAKLDNPKRNEILPVATIIEAMGDITDGVTIADLGCGTGYLTIPLAKHIDGHGNVYAVDVNPEALSILKERSAGLANIELVQSEENSIPIPDGMIDISFLVTVFHELDDPIKFLMEIRRISKPFHTIIVVDWNQVKGEMGPPLGERVPEDDVIRFFKTRGYALIKRFTLSPYMYGMVFIVPTCNPLDRVWM